MKLGVASPGTTALSISTLRRPFRGSGEATEIFQSH
jgi:hypothetical protein